MIKEQLREIKHIDRRIEGIQSEIDRLRSHLTTVNYGAAKVRGGSRRDLSATVCKIEVYEKELNAEIDALYSRKQAVCNLVRTTLSASELEVIELYYFQTGYTWERIAVKLNYSFRQVQRIHRRALRKLVISSAI